MSIFWKPLITKSKGHQIKFILRRLNGTFWNKIRGLFLNATWQQVDSKWATTANIYLTIAFCKKVLNSNWLETLRIKWNHWESLFYLNRERLRPFIIQDMSYDYKKNDKHRQILHEKLCTKAMSPPINSILRWSLKKIKILVCIFCRTTIVSQMTPIIVIVWKENKNLLKRRQIWKNHENWFYENWFFQEERPFEENKTVMKSKFYFSKVKWCELYIEMLSYNLTEIKLADLKKILSFFYLKQIFSKFIANKSFRLKE